MEEKDKNIDNNLVAMYKDQIKGGRREWTYSETTLHTFPIVSSLFAALNDEYVLSIKQVWDNKNTFVIKNKYKYIKITNNEALKPHMFESFGVAHVMG